MAIKRGSATLSTAYRGNNQLSKIYVGSTQIWPTTSAQTNWFTNGLSLVLNENTEQQYVTKGLSLKFTK